MVRSYIYINTLLDCMLKVWAGGLRIAKVGGSRDTPAYIYVTPDIPHSLYINISMCIVYISTSSHINKYHVLHYNLTICKYKTERRLINVRGV